MNVLIKYMQENGIEKIIEALKGEDENNDYIRKLKIGTFNLLQWASLMNCSQCIKILIKKYYFNINIKHEGISSNNKKFYSILKEYDLKDDINTEEKKDYTILQILKKNKKIELFEYAGYTPLMIAIEKGNTEACKILIELEADIEIKDDRGMSPLMLAVDKGTTDIVKILLAQNAKLDEEDNDSWSAFMYACSRDNLDIINTLLIQNADPWSQNKYGQNALMMACNYNNIENVKYILDYNSKKSKEMINLQDQYGVTALMKACEFNNVALVNLLFDYAADVSIVSKTNFSCLMIASKHGNLSIIKLLIKKYNCKLNQKDIDDRTAIYFARLNNHKKVEKYFESLGCKLKDDKHKISAIELSQFSINKSYFLR